MRHFIFLMLAFLTVAGPVTAGQTFRPSDEHQILWLDYRMDVDDENNTPAFGRNYVAGVTSGCLYVEDNRAVGTGMVRSCQSSTGVGPQGHWFITRMRVGLRQQDGIWPTDQGCDFRLVGDDGSVSVPVVCSDMSLPPVHGVAMPDGEVYEVVINQEVTGFLGIQTKAGSNNSQGSGTPACNNSLEVTIMVYGYLLPAVDITQ